jgi:mono/diheme cytochrome c family protein
MKKLLCTLMSLAIGCVDAEQIREIASLEGEEEIGEELFLSYCARCHGADGTGDRAPSLLRKGIVEMTTEENAAEIQRRMRIEGLSGVLSNQDIADIISYLYVLQGR